ncbi:26370_t:CDS:2 [Dentiscutata erythropus]|uniref:26370_t:CDS:1 n=1 Tax=Dentiscutata erythropus TaxID=1348616 RepID=A0A9N9C5I5_9GLOM|nr:26370_t:CDS:2 [Dentiscutata erythropus]
MSGQRTSTHIACQLELELEEENLTEPVYTTIQVGNAFTQLEDQLIANEIKESQEENQKITIPITKDKSTFIGYTLDNQQQQTITQLFLNNADIFTTEFSKLCKTNVVYYTIHTGDSYPIKQ